MSGRLSHSRFSDGPRLLAEIGALTARCGLEVAPGAIEQLKEFDTRGFDGPAAVLRRYLEDVGTPLVRHAGIATANPIEGDQVRMTNRDWRFSIEALRQSLQLRTMLVVNDFTALAMSLPYVGASGRLQVGGGEARDGSVIGLLGPGTGLGISGLIPAEDRWVTLGSEGGHASFAPNDAREVAVLQFAWSRHPHVSAERLISAQGMKLIHEALAAQHGGEGAAAPQLEDIIQAGLDGSSALCVETLHCFCSMLGTVAADLALNLGALGGIYIGGEIVPRLGRFLQHSGFRQRFESKGRFSDYLARIPTFVITAQAPGLLGLSAILAENLRHADKAHLLDLVHAKQASLSRAEQRVAELVIQKPRVVINAPVGEIALAADVSQPTVIRFCRSLGFKGLSDFKLALASGLTGTVPVRHSQVSHDDEAHELSAKVLDNTVSAILRFRDTLNVQSVERATRMLGEAKRIEFFGMGNSAVVAQDGQHKFLRFGIPTAAYPDPYVQQMAAGLLGRGDVVVVISGGGQLPEMLRCVDVALARGADVIAITSGHSALARRASVCIPVDHGEDSPDFIAMISRILHLLVIDVLAVSVALARRDSGARSADKNGDDDELPTVTDSSAHRISHMG